MNIDYQPSNQCVEAVISDIEAKTVEISPLPWSLRRTHPEPETAAVIIELHHAGFTKRGESFEIACGFNAPVGSQRAADMGYIVKAVNNHRQLVAALEQIAAGPDQAMATVARAALEEII